MNEIIIYLFKKRLLYVGWIMRRIHIETPTSYYDNSPTVTMYSEEKIAYVRFGFSRKRVHDKVIKYALRLKEKEEARLKASVDDLHHTRRC